MPKRAGSGGNPRTVRKLTATVSQRSFNSQQQYFLLDRFFDIIHGSQFKSPSTRNRTTVSTSLGSIWISLALSFTALPRRILEIWITGFSLISDFEINPAAFLLSLIGKVVLGPAGLSCSNNESILPGSVIMSSNFLSIPGNLIKLSMSSQSKGLQSTKPSFPDALLLTGNNMVLPAICRWKHSQPDMISLDLRKIENFQKFCYKLSYFALADFHGSRYQIDFLWWKVREFIPFFRFQGYLIKEKFLE